MEFTFEVFLTKKYVTKEEWQELITIISNYNGLFRKWKIFIFIQNNKVRYFVKTNCSLPSSINRLKSFILKQSKVKILNHDTKAKSITFLKFGSNAIDLKNYMKVRRNENLHWIEITFRKIYENKISKSIKMITSKNKSTKKYKVFLGIPSEILSIDFNSNYNMIYQGAPKYLDISKCLHLLKTDNTNSILKVDSFPYLQGDYYLNQKDISFQRHSIVFGSSGCGKSKFLSLLIDNIRKNDQFNSNYKIVAIDPHASLENDIGGLGTVIDFKEKDDSINLFFNDADDTVISVELLLDVLRGLMPNGYNSKLERVLRHSLYLLLISEEFNFKTLRKLLIELDYRNELIKKTKDFLPISIIEFFLSEFNDIKTKSYTEAISPIIALIDEMEMIPVFNKEIEGNLKTTMNENFLTIFSLDRTKLGDKVTKTIAGLVMQQLLTLVQNHSFEEHIILVVDEVATIENPILNRFLSEARKYNLSLILAGQYFGGITEKLKKSIFANVINYYMFRVSKEDANVLVDNFNMKIPLNDTKEQKIKLITELQDRECIIRISANGCLLPAIKCRTLDFKSIPRKKKIKKDTKKEIEDMKKKEKKEFSSMSHISLKDILLSNSTSRKVVKK